MSFFILWTDLNWLYRCLRAAFQQDRGVLKDTQKSRMDFCESTKNVLNSSQGTPERTQRGLFKLRLRRMRIQERTENSSIHLFFVFAVVLLTLVPVKVLATNAERREAQIQQVADDFEGMMLQFMYGQMQRANQEINAGDDNPFAPSNGEKIFRAMQDEIVMRQLAKRRPIGMGDMIARQLKGETGIARRNLVKLEKTPGG